MGRNSLDRLPGDVLEHVPKHVRLKYALQARIGKLVQGDPLPSIASIQDEFHLAQGTVVRALRELQNEGVVEARHGSGFFATGYLHLQTVAIYISVDVLHPDAGHFPRLLLRQLEQAAGQFGDLRFRHYFAAGSDCLWQDRVCSLAYDVRRRLVDGIIVFGLYGGEFGDLPVPVVSWQLLPQVQAHVMVDEEAMVRKGLEALRRRGCRTVAYMGGHPETLPSEDSPYLPMARHLQRCRDCFLQEAKRLRLVTRPGWIMPGSSSPGAAAATTNGKVHFHELWGAAEQKPDGLLSTDDYTSRGALAAMAELGVVPGRDLQVASQVNRGSDLLDGQPVIRLEVDPGDIARALLKTVSGLMAGRKDVPKLTLVEPHLEP